MKGGTILTMRYPDHIESALEVVSDKLTGTYAVSRRTVSLLLLQGDPEMIEIVRAREERGLRQIKRMVEDFSEASTQPVHYQIGVQQQHVAAKISAGVVSQSGPTRISFREKLSRAMMRPITGIPILLIVLYFGLYQFVGVLGAGTMVDFIESKVFGEWINPWLTIIITRVLPVTALQDLLIGEYGVITLGISYAFAIVLPIVGTFFLVFSVIEDSGYLPRLAMLIDRVFKLLGLNGRAVIPLVLGFGCDTMATIVTRTQETARERVLTTLLLALAIPCSAQLGVVLGILSGNPASLLIWAGMIVLVFILVGIVAARVIPGKNAKFYMELPPLRLPRLQNILIKTYSRLRWYLFEVIPLFLIASVLLWLGDLTGVFDLFVEYVMAPIVSLIGLPEETAVAFFFGFFRRDFGAAGLYDLHSQGILTGVPLVVASVTLTLFLPCVAQFAVMIKERGIKTTLAIAAFIFPFAFFVGFLLNFVLTGLGIKL
ncbi:MAG: ferrous iron transporter B [Spirochaetales bacterium]|nr:ferrous iron transporter B [Spirochaetales bacterium]